MERVSSFPDAENLNVVFCLFVLFCQIETRGNEPLHQRKLILWARSSVNPLKLYVKKKCTGMCIFSYLELENPPTDYEPSHDSMEERESTIISTEPIILYNLE